jgi:glycine cleavage system regulatory protein
METKTYAAPESGTPIFRIEALVSIPAKLNVNTLRARFAEIQREENIDIEISLVKRGRST